MAQKGRDCSTLSNEQRRAYSVDVITQATISLLSSKPLEEISISQITSRAQVSRNSFYRNFESKKEILKNHTGHLLQLWSQTEAKDARNVNLAMFSTLFDIVETNRGFFSLLLKRGYFYLLLETLEEVIEPPADASLVEEYTHSFFLHGVYGWLERWVARDFQESADEMTKLLVSGGYQG